jgi:DEAD/DEAH box helicase domain-containing protein
MIYLDVETIRSSNEVGGWFPEKLGLAVAVTFDSKTGYRTWFENQVQNLVMELVQQDKIVGYNLLGFDYGVLKAYDTKVYQKLQDKTIDLLDIIYRKIGFRIKLDDLTTATFGKTKTADGLKSIQWWKEGKYQLVVDYCKEDVSLTKELYEFGIREKIIYYPSYGAKKSIPISW